VSGAADVGALAQAEAELAQAGALPFPLPAGDLHAVIAGALSGLERGDWWVPGLRERVGGTLRGAPIERLVDPAVGARPYKIAPASPSPATRALVAVGLALGSGRCALAHLGVGALGDGALTEALNLGALHAAPVILLVAVHPLTGDAPLGAQSAATPAALAGAYGWRTVEVDGTDVAAIAAAVAASREGGPTLITARLPGPKTT